MEKINSNVQFVQIHKNLLEIVSQSTFSVQKHLKNLFACCFVFHFKEGTTYTIYVPQVFISCAPVFSEETKNYPCAYSVQTLLLKCYQINKSILEIQYLGNLYTKKIQKTKTKTPLILSMENVFSDRKKQKGVFKSPIKDKASAECVRITDSETNAIYYLNDESRLSNLIAKLPNKEIASIEFHGCSTFDMCPFCFTHMNMVQFLSNNNAKAGFLCLLKNLLIEKKLLTNPNIPTTIIISSYKNGNYLHNQTYGWMGTVIKENCVNQFRMSDYKIDNFIVQDVPSGTNDISFALEKADPA